MARPPNILQDDPTLLPHRKHLESRLARFHAKLQALEAHYGSLESMASAHLYFGFNRGQCQGEAGVWYREWAPGADTLHLIGDFNDWSRSSHPLVQDDSGEWCLFIPETEVSAGDLDGSRVKVCVRRHDQASDRIPAYIREVSKGGGTDYCGIVRFEFPYDWQHALPAATGSPRIYEAHVGMAQERKAVGSFDAFRESVLPRIVDQGYTCIQLMGIQQHPYYASFGYHVSNFFAVSDHFGAATDLKRLIDAAHGQGLRVFMDVVHSHSVKNHHEGLNGFDGTGHQYFHPGARGNHPAWDSKVFNYRRRHVVQFLLSNLSYWLEEFRFDGFRFDGVGSMFYLDHGFMRSFRDYDDYFDDKELDHDGMVYLQLANVLVHRVRPDAVTIAEDVSGMPGTAYPVEEGGIGFDYRMTMGIPDHWINIVKHFREEDWPMGAIAHLMGDRRACEKAIAYCESHDQSIVGDVPLAQLLMGPHMPGGMSIGVNDPHVERGMAMHNLIRFITFALGGDGWLNFIGNEFGHPDWVDFPREGNDFSYDNAIRKWSLVDDPKLKYRFLNAFDRALQTLDDEWGLLAAPNHQTLVVDEIRKTIVATRAGLTFAFNFHPTSTYERFEVPGARGDWRMVLNTDATEFGGKGYLATVTGVSAVNALTLRLPPRSGACLAPVPS